ncbi:MAG: methyltransferase domain-containing protein [Acidimicrobiales bacterium]
MRLVNIGAGSGPYEPSDCVVVAIEPSAVMVEQRPPGSAPAIRATAEHVPLVSGWADVAMTLLSVHHWSDWRAGLREMRRLARRRVGLTYDAELHSEFWLMRDYVPEVADVERLRVPPIDDIAMALGGEIGVQPLSVPWDCLDGVLPAHWRRPSAYLDARVRACCSGLAQADPRVVDRGVRALGQDLRSGAWQRRYGDVLSAEEFDAGFRIVTSSEN